MRNPPQKPRECAMLLSVMAYSSNSRWQNRIERPNQTTNNGDITGIAKHPVSDGHSLWHLFNYREAEVLTAVFVFIFADQVIYIDNTILVLLFIYTWM